jgi:hypothetical protein
MEIVHESDIITRKLQFKKTGTCGSFKDGSLLVMERGGFQFFSLAFSDDSFLSSDVLSPFLIKIKCSCIFCRLGLRLEIRGSETEKAEACLCLLNLRDCCLLVLLVLAEA